MKRHAGEAGAGPHAVLRSWINRRRGTEPRPCAYLSMTVPLLQPGSSRRAFTSDQVKNITSIEQRKIQNSSSKFPEFQSRNTRSSGLHGTRGGGIRVNTNMHLLVTRECERGKVGKCESVKAGKLEGRKGRACTPKVPSFPQPGRAGKDKGGG